MDTLESSQLIGHPEGRPGDSAKGRTKEAGAVGGRGWQSSPPTSLYPELGSLDQDLCLDFLLLSHLKSGQESVFFILLRCYLLFREREREGEREGEKHQSMWGQNLQPRLGIKPATFDFAVRHPTH